MKKSFGLTGLIAAFAAVFISAGVTAKPVDCDLTKCNKSADGLWYCPSDACKEER